MPFGLPNPPWFSKIRIPFITSRKIRPAVATAFSAVALGHGLSVSIPSVLVNFEHQLHQREEQTKYHWS